MASRVQVQPLRLEFEPQLISPDGAHWHAEGCALGWGAWLAGDPELARLRLMVEQASLWLQGVSRTKAINRHAPTSYSYKHEVEHWWRKRAPRGTDCYIIQGALVMAAARAGFIYKPNSCRMIGPTAYYNADLNIGRKRSHVLVHA